MNLDKYIGHKNRSGLFHTIINNIPAHETYVELFAGSAAILDKINNKCDNVILNDINPDTVDALCKKFPTARITNNNAIDILDAWLFRLKNDALKSVFIFLDPPYHHDTRENTALYDFEMTGVDHVQLLNAALQTNANVMIIHPKHELYDTKLSTWRKIEVKVRYHQKTSLECLYMNYDIPTTLQDTSYLGSDSWDRQRIKRKGDRLIKKITELPVLEKQYILDRLKEFKD